VTKRTTGKPTLADLRDSGSLEQDASIVLFVYVDMNKFVLSGLSDGDVDDYIKDNDELYLRVEVGKQRNGAVFSESVVLEKPYGVFTLASEFNKTY
jgi:replicative DNA helicase